MTLSINLQCFYLEIIDLSYIFAVEIRAIIDTIISRTMKAILGQYYYAPHRRSFGVWQWTSVNENGASGSFVKDFKTKEEAREYVWQMNGWGKPKSKLN